MTELLGVGPGDRVLEIGTGSGYQAAVLAAIGCRVTTIERHAELAAAARERLAELGLRRRASRSGWATERRCAGRSAVATGSSSTAAAPADPGGAPRAARPAGGRLVLPVGPRDRQELLAGRPRRQRVDARRTDGAGRVRAARRARRVLEPDR